MTSIIENVVVLLLVATAAVYTVVRLRRVAAGESKCVCGSKGCGSAAAGGGRVQDATVRGDPGSPNGSLPVLSPSCNQGCRGCEKS
jgi:hypothetical protein